MDDCHLEKLSIKPGQLSPDFNRNVTEYSVIIPSDIDKLNIEPLTSDTGASYSISGSDGLKVVSLKEGEVTDIKIEVTAEDGTVKNYFIHAKRLSAKDANLSNLTVDKGTLQADFSSDVTEYTCTLPCSVASVKVIPVAADPKCEVLLNGKKSGGAVVLNVGETRVEIQTTSPDGSNKKIYLVDLIRKQLPRFVRFVDPKKCLEFECPVSLSPFYRPITVKGSHPKHTYSAPFIDSLVRTTKVDLLSGQTLQPDWRVVDRELEAKMSLEPAVIPFTYGGTTDPMHFGQLAGQLDKCNVAPKIEDPQNRFQKSALSTNHTVQFRKWEKQLHQVFDETDPTKLVLTAQSQLSKYYNSLPTTAQGFHQFNKGESPLDFLLNAAQSYATAIKFQPKDAHLHFLLAMVLEEKYFAEDMFGLKKAETGDDLPSFNIQARESSKKEEVLAICNLRKVAAGAPVALQLKALDEEYHHLLDSGQSGKADHVQELYAWYSKTVSQEGAAAHKVENADNPLGQAYLKYLDAVVLDESKAIYNFHVGRLLVTQGNYEEAVKRLEAALCWSSHQLARIYLGLALSLQKGGPQQRLSECVMYLLEGMEVLLTTLSKQAATPDENIRKNWLYAENLLRPTNVYLLRGLIQLGRMLAASSNIKDTMSAHDVFHTAALLAAQAMPDVYHADVYQQLEWVLLDAHAVLLEMLSSGKKDEELIAHRCQRLLALIDHATIPQNEQLLDLQEKTSQNLVCIQPCNSHALYLLGSSQLKKFENSGAGEAATKMLHDARMSFEASTELHGKPAEGAVPELIANQQWFKDRQKKEQEKMQEKTAEAMTTPVAKPASAADKGGATTGKITTAPAARGRGFPSQPAKAVDYGKARMWLAESEKRSVLGTTTDNNSGQDNGRKKKKRKNSAWNRFMDSESGSDLDDNNLGTAQYQLEIIGGSNVRNVTARVMTTVFSQQMAEGYCWTGGAMGKREFQNLRLKDSIFNIVGRGAAAAKKGAATLAAVGGRGVTAAAKAPVGKTPGTTVSSGKTSTTGSKSGSKCKIAIPCVTATHQKPRSAAVSKPEPAPETVSEPVKPKKPVPVNTKTCHAYLGLARVNRALGDHKQAQKYYDIVIAMAPQVHDAYIESAEMLMKSDPLSAVDVYMKFPVSDNPSFDDAYIFGEIISILMKFEKYDDDRLASCMITYGKILGLGVLDRYVKILEEKFKNKLLQTVYAGVNGKAVDDPDMQAFFKFKCWI